MTRQLVGASRIVALALAAGVIAAGCTGGTAPTPPTGGITPAPVSSDVPGASASAAIPESPVAGVVTSVDAVSLTEVRGFTITSAAGQDLTFVIGTLENGAEFAPGHLKEHMTSATRSSCLLPAGERRARGVPPRRRPVDGAPGVPTGRPDAIGRASAGGGDRGLELLGRDHGLERAADDPLAVDDEHPRLGHDARTP